MNESLSRKQLDRIIAIAESSGWHPHPDNHRRPLSGQYWTFGGTKYGDTNQVASLYGEPDDWRGGATAPLPNYLLDHNAMHAVLMTMDAKQRRLYSTYLTNDVCGNPVDALVATASQQADAYGRVKKLWKR